MAKAKSGDDTSFLGRLLSLAKDRLTALTDPAIREFKNQQAPGQWSTLRELRQEESRPQAKVRPVNQQSIDPRWVELVEVSQLYREVAGERRKMPCHGSKRDIQRAHRLFLKAPEHWCARLDAVAPSAATRSSAQCEIGRVSEQESGSHEAPVGNY